MKKLLLLFLIFLISHNLYSWDSVAAKYLPLQVGNTWVYYSTYSFQIPPFFGSSYLKYKITGITDTLGKRYYVLRETNYIISNGGGCHIYNIDILRIDSSTMNIYYGANCFQNESLRDSLKAKKYDTSWSCWNHNSYNLSLCIDTSLFKIFGINVPSKKYQGWNSTSLYIKNIGIGSWSIGELGTQCNNVLKGCVINGFVYGDTSFFVGINKISSEVPEIFFLSQSYPNPFNPATKIQFSVPAPSPLERARVRLVIYDALGHEVQALVNEQLQPGTYEAEFNGSNFSSGVYYYTLSWSDYFETKRMVLIK